MKRLTGVKALLLRKAHLTVLPTEVGPCEFCKDPSGKTRYFVACKMDKIRVLCDRHYLELRTGLEEVLSGLLKSLEEEAAAQK